MKPVRWLGIAVVALAGVLAIAACGSEEPTATPTQPAAAPTAEPGADWEAEWAAALEGARNEGKISIISGSSSSANIASFTAAFKQLTGGEVEFTELRAPDIVARLPEEYAAGQHNWDIILLGGSSGISEGLDEAGVLGNLNESFIYPDITEDDTWVGNFSDLWVDNDTQTYKLQHFGGLSQGSAWWVNREKLPQNKFNDIEDLFKLPEAKGRFCTFDPRVEGASDSNFGQIAAMYGKDMVRRLFTELDMVVLRDYRKLTEDTIRGECWISVGARVPDFQAQGIGLQLKQVFIYKPGIVDEFKDRLKVTCCGAGKSEPVAQGWVGGGSANNFVAVAKDPPHPNAAKVYVNWILSKEGQMAWALPNNGSDCSRRTDLQAWCAEQWTKSPYDWYALPESGTLISPHTRSNFFLRIEGAHDIGFEVFGR